MDDTYGDYEVFYLDENGQEQSDIMYDCECADEARNRFDEFHNEEIIRVRLYD